MSKQATVRLKQDIPLKGTGSSVFIGISHKDRVLTLLQTGLGSITSDAPHH